MLSSAISSSQNVPLSLFADPMFRQDLKLDPIKALAAHGIKVQPSDLPDEIRLPSFEKLDRISATPGNGNGPGSNNGTGPPTPSSPIAPPFWLLFVG
jgi:hypothetical protein